MHLHVLVSFRFSAKMAGSFVPILQHALSSVTLGGYPHGVWEACGFSDASGTGSVPLRGPPGAHPSCMYLGAHGRD